MELTPFSKYDWYAFSGCLGNPVINNGDTCSVICDDQGIFIAWHPEADDDNAFKYAHLKCDFETAKEIVYCWSAVPSIRSLKAMNFHVGEG